MARQHIWLVFWLCSFVAGVAQSHPGTGWPEYGGDAGGQRYSASTQINLSNVSQLQQVWSFHTRAIQPNGTNLDRVAKFEATPILWKGALFFDSPFDTVFALDAATGKQRWSFDPKVDHRANIYIPTSRGVALWHDPAAHGRTCGDRVYVATLDKRLIALDASTGQPCKDFGNQGTVDLSKNIYISESWLLEYNSPPQVVGDHIILGSSVGDNQTTNSPSGEVRAFDARSGMQVWSWQPVRWEGAVRQHTSGAGNAWAPLAADPTNDLVFVPTGAPALDYWGGTRIGDNRDANSLVALRASTGEKVWAFQLVHHDLWDYDTASQPLLFTFKGKIPAVAITNKTGMIYVFNRLNGQPLFPIEERPVPQSTVAGEVTWPTQPFSSLPSTIPNRLSPSDLQGSPASQQFCREQLNTLDYKGLFTPPSQHGTLLYPSALGGPNWGSSALDPQTDTLYTRVSSAAFRLYLVPKSSSASSTAQRAQLLYQRLLVKLHMDKSSAATLLPGIGFRPPDMGAADVNGSEMRGTPYSMLLALLAAPDGTPCAPEPYGRLVATNLNTGKQLWSVAHGKMGRFSGSFGMGGAIVTAGKLVFVGSTTDPFLRAYSSVDGHLLWQGRLPATASATAMTYSIENRQFVVIASGGHWSGKEDEADQLVAFALPLPGGQKR